MTSRTVPMRAAICWFVKASSTVIVFRPETLPYIPPPALSTLAEHADWALWTLWIVIPLAFLRLVVAWMDRQASQISRLPARGLLLLVAMVGNGLLLIAADRGGEGVFRHGVGVAAVGKTEPVPAETPTRAEGPPEERLAIGADGSLHWTPLDVDGEALGSILIPATGSPADTAIWAPQGLET